MRQYHFDTMKSSDEAMSYLEDHAPILVSRLRSHNESPLESPDVYTIVCHILLQYSKHGTTKFTLSELQSQIDTPTSEDTVRNRLETLTTVGFVECNSATQEYQYTLRQPLTIWTNDPSTTDLPIVSPSRSIISAPTDQTSTVWYLLNSNLPDLTSERLESYTVKLSVSTVVCLLLATLVISAESQLRFIAGGFLFMATLVFASLAGSMLCVWMIQEIRDRYLSLSSHT